MKTLSKIIKFIIIGSVWTYLYVRLSRFLVLEIWNFDILSKQWSIIGDYWNSGGKITGKDFVFLLTLIFIIPIWLWSLIKLCKANLLNIILFPITYYNKKMIDKYGQDTKRVVLKNIGAMQKLDLNYIVEEKLKKVYPDSKEEVDIRSTIQEKINKVKK